MVDVREVVVEVVVKVLDVEPGMVTPRANFMHDLGADSLDLTELVMTLEEQFLIEISDIEDEEINTVQDTISIIEERLID